MKLIEKIKTLISSTETTPQTTAVSSYDVLFVNGCDTSVPHPARYRVTHQREQLELWGITTTQIFYCDIVPEDALKASCFILFRCPLTENLSLFIDKAHSLNKKVYFDIDDLVIDTSYTNELPIVKSFSPEEKALFDDGVNRNGQTMAYCDEGIASTYRIAAEMKKTLPKVHLNRNVASKEMVELSKAAVQNKDNHSKEIRLGYFSGSATHNEDFLLISEALVSVMRTNPFVKLCVVGDLTLPNSFEPLASQITRFNKVNWKELPSLIASVDINLAPLENTLFNEAKSENKWVEAALVKVPSIASDVGAFHDMIINGKTGLLCSSTQEWIEALLLLITDKQIRHTIAEQAYYYCMRNCTTLFTGYKLARILKPTSVSNIDTLLPTNEEAKANWVQRYFDEMNCNHPSDISNISSKNPWENVGLNERIALVKQAREEHKKIALLIYERNCGDNATFRYLGYNIYEHLLSSKTWFATWLFVDEFDNFTDKFEYTNIFLFIRVRMRPEILELSNQAKIRRIPTAFVIDDNAVGKDTAEPIIKAMASNPQDSFERNFWLGVTERFELTAHASDGIIATLAPFSEMLSKKYHKPASTIHLSLNKYQLQIAQSINEQVSQHAYNRQKFFRIGYFSGTSSHQEDFALVEPVISSLLEKYDDIQLVLGGHLNLSNNLYQHFISGKIILLPLVNYQTLQIVQASVDVVLAPLSVNTFTNCKSALKVFEAAIMQTPACASPSTAYTEAIVQGKTGYICSTKQEWTEALLALYHDSNLQESMGKQAYDYVMTKYYGQTIRHEIEQAFDDVLKFSILPLTSDISLTINQAATQVKDWDNPFEVNPLFA